MNTLSFEPPRTADVWQVLWLHREPTVARYQAPVPLAQVLSEHQSAIAAEPLTENQDEH